jgi:hypothetical protein
MKRNTQQLESVIKKYFPDGMTIYELQGLHSDGHIDLEKMIKSLENSNE